MRKVLFIYFFFEQVTHTWEGNTEGATGFDLRQDGQRGPL